MFLGGDNLNNRIKNFRKQLNLTQEEFSSRIGLSRNFIAQIETGAKNPSDRTISDICREFGINEEWLRTGSGEMRIPVEDEAVAAVSDLVEKSNPLYDVIKGIMVAYQKLDGASREVIDQFILDAIPQRGRPQADPYSEAPATPEELEEKYPPVDMKKDAG